MLRRTALFLIAANLAMIACNGFFVLHNVRTLRELRSTGAAVEASQDALRRAWSHVLPHPCGSIIWPGEQCTAAAVVHR